MTSLFSLSSLRPYIFPIVTFALTGCTKSCDKKEATTSSVNEQNVAAPANGVTEIQMWDNEDPEPAKKLDAWMIQFMANNPDIRVVRTTYQTEDLRQKFITTATAGKAADIVFGPSDMTGPLVTANLLQPIDTFTDISLFATAATDAVQVNGKVWGAPMSYGNHLLLMFNKDLIKAAPTTTDELIAVAKTNSNPDKKQYGLVMNINEPFWFAPTMGAYGAWPLNVGADGKVSISLGTEENKKALTFWKSLKFVHKIVPSECDYDCARGLFAEKKAAMIINGDWYVDEAKKSLGEKLGIAPLPIVSATGKAMTPMVSGRYLFLNKDLNGTKAEAVKKFLAFLTSKPIQVEMSSSLGRIPSLIEAQKDPTVIANPVIKSLIDAAANGKAMPPQIEMRAAWDGMRPVLQKMMNGEIEPDQAAGEMQTIANERLKGLNE